MEENKEIKKSMEGTPAESGVGQAIVKVEKQKRNFTRDEVNKMINAEKQKERQALLKELEEQKIQTDKLEKKDEYQKRLYELEKERANKAENKLNAYKLKDEMICQFNRKGIPLDIIQTIDFERETEESINLKLAIFEKTYKSERDKVIMNIQEKLYLEAKKIEAEEQ